MSPTTEEKDHVYKIPGSRRLFGRKASRTRSERSKLRFKNSPLHDNVLRGLVETTRGHIEKGSVRHYQGHAARRFHDRGLTSALLKPLAPP